MLRLASILALGGLALAACPAAAWAQNGERNLWPFRVEWTDLASGEPRVSSWGPFGYESPAGEGATRSGLRPVWEETRTADGDQVAATVLYPLWHGERSPSGDTRTSRLFNLVNSSHEADGTSRFDAWPFYFSRDTGNPDSSYRAVFPFYGDINERFGQDRMTWALFPLYGRFEKGDMVTTTTPWPFLKTVSGGDHRGFEFWPLGGWRETEGESREHFALWPFYYRKETGLASDEPSLQTGLLPFYALDRQPGYRSETYVWPFFGYVDRTEPYTYRANHYFWPLWVQGRGDDRYINRWAPFYSHSEVKGMTKTWLLWPLWRQAEWEDPRRHHERRQLLYFLYHDTRQTSLTNPDAPAASKTHVWPFFSAWDNGAGRRQVQALSPIDVFLPHNEHTRRMWSPLFAIYRFDQAAPGEARHSWLWNAVTWQRSDSEDLREFHLGPLFGYRQKDGRKRFTFLAGSIGVETSARRDRGWRLIWGGKERPDSFQASVESP